MQDKWILLPAAAIFSGFIVFLIIRFAEALKLVQVPIARSSHVKPTPTGGGIGIVIAATIFALFLPSDEYIAVLIPALGLMIAVVGLIDDRHPLPAKVRLPIQASVVTLALITTNATVALAGEADLFLHILAGLVLIVGGVWWINLFNFMDGIDGIAGQQAIMMLGSAMTISFHTHPEAITSWSWWMTAVVAASTFGFLVFNWPPARIFMGDAGSTFLGFIIVALAFISLAVGWMSVQQWLLLAVLFASDATVTLIIRFLGRDKLSQAHRSHAYQRLSRRFGGAKPVSTCAWLINLLLVLPLALCLPEGLAGTGIVILAYGLAAGVILWVGAGLPDATNSSISNYRARLVRLYRENAS